MEEPDLDDFYAIQRYVNDSATHIANKTKELLNIPEFDSVDPDDPDSWSDGDPEEADPRKGIEYWKTYWNTGAELADLIDFYYMYSRKRQDPGSRSIQAQIHKFIDALIANFYLLEERSPIKDYLEIQENVDDIRYWRIKLVTVGVYQAFHGRKSCSMAQAQVQVQSRRGSDADLQSELSSSLSLSSRQFGWTCSDTGSEFHSEFESEYSAYSEDSAESESESSTSSIESVEVGF